MYAGIRGVVVLVFVYGVFSCQVAMGKGFGRVAS